MKVIKKIIVSILVMLIFLYVFIPKSNANFFDDENKDSEIIETIDEDDGGIFEKIIAKMIRWNCRICF